MRISRSIGFRKFVGFPRKSDPAKHREGKLAVSMYSDFFSSVTDNIMCTNRTYGNLLKELESTLSVYPEKETVLLTVYESSPSGGDIKDSIVIGFRKYIAGCLARAKSTLGLHLITFTGLCLVGILIEFLIYGAFPDRLPVWVHNVFDILAWVFVWQFVAYMAFEFIKEIKAIRRLEQILHIEYKFRHWE